VQEWELAYAAIDLKWVSASAARVLAVAITAITAVTPVSAAPAAIPRTASLAAHECCKKATEGVKDARRM
jgi:hypothetical protein